MQAEFDLYPGDCFNIISDLVFRYPVLVDHPEQPEQPGQPELSPEECRDIAEDLRHRIASKKSKFLDWVAKNGRQEIAENQAVKGAE